MQQLGLEIKSLQDDSDSSLDSESMDSESRRTFHPGGEDPANDEVIHNHPDNKTWEQQYSEEDDFTEKWF